MRFLAAAAAGCLGLWMFSLADASVPGVATPGVATPGVATPGVATPSSPVAPSVPTPGDAAAKHAKRTACLKQAKTRKLVGAEKTAFIKSCTAAP